MGGREILAAHAEARRDEVADDALVEGVAGDRHAVGADDVRGAPAALTHARPDGDDREVAGAAAEVADQDPLVALQPRLVGVRGRDRLVLEHDLVEAGEADRRQQTFGGERVELGVGRVGEVHRPAEDDPPRRRPRREPELIAHVLADERDQLLERVVLRADAGSFERPVREVRLQRLDEAALRLRRKVAFDRRRSCDRRLLWLEVQDRRKGRPGAVSARELREMGRARGVNKGDGAVRRAEIDSYPGGRRVHFPLSVPITPAAAPPSRRPQSPAAPAASWQSQRRAAGLRAHRRTPAG